MGDFVVNYTLLFSTAVHGDHNLEKTWKNLEIAIFGPKNLEKPGNWGFCPKCQKVKKFS